MLFQVFAPPAPNKPGAVLDGAEPVLYHTGRVPPDVPVQFYVRNKEGQNVLLGVSVHMENVAGQPLVSLSFRATVLRGEAEQAGSVTTGWLHPNPSEAGRYGRRETFPLASGVTYELRRAGDLFEFRIFALPGIIPKADGNQVGIQIQTPQTPRLLAMEVYPNPATTRVNIDYYIPGKEVTGMAKCPGFSGPMTFEIIDQLGHVVKTLIDPNVTLNEGSEKRTMAIDISNLRTGSYLVRMRAAAGGWKDDSGKPYINLSSDFYENPGRSANPVLNFGASEVPVPFAEAQLQVIR